MKKKFYSRWLTILATSVLSLTLTTTSCLALSDNSLEAGDPIALDIIQEQVGDTIPVESFASSSTSLTKVFRCKNKGYQLTLPSDSIITTNGTGFDARVTTGDCTLEISKEWSPYSSAVSDLAEGLKKYVPDFKWSDGKDQYIGYYESRFLLNKDWQKNNNVSVSDVQTLKAGGYSGIMYSAVIADVAAGKPDGYTYMYLKLNSQWFLRIVAKYRSTGTTPASNSAQESKLKSILSTLYTFTPSTSASTTKPKYKPERKAAWSQETQEFYDKLKAINTDSSPENSLLWGIYSDHMTTTGINEKVPMLEEKLNYSFDAVMSYCHFYEAFPTSFMNQAYEEGKYVEMTFQITDNNNEDLYARSLFLRLYRQDSDVIEVIRKFARDAKAFGHPFLFRPCNEMNSDWVSYGGVANMADPDIFIENWRTIYKIFEEEGVDNCIWVFNPNDRNAPPDDWNGALNYYPGNEYVDVIGVTGYNNGTYYTQWREEWREFETIYDQIQDEYGYVFGDFPWIITEFSSSSVGGDKPSWIRSMFKKISKYKNIKLAVWFDSADYDSSGNVARPYWLDETPDTLRAFKSGLTGALFFEDLKTVQWAYDAIYEVTDAGYFKGTSNTTFSPSMSVSRAMIFTVIARMAGVDTSTTGVWYQPGLAWAMENGITDGTYPDASVTREQLVTMLYRWSKSHENDDSIVTENESSLTNAISSNEGDSSSDSSSEDETASSGDHAASPDGGQNTDSTENKNGFVDFIDSTAYTVFLNYPDYSMIHDWARDAMKWALEQGIITGNDLGQIDPQGTATRAQTAVIIQRFTALQNR